MTAWSMEAALYPKIPALMRPNMKIITQKRIQSMVKTIKIIEDDGGKIKKLLKEKKISSKFLTGFSMYFFKQADLVAPTFQQYSPA